MIDGRSLTTIRMIMMSSKCLLQGNRHLDGFSPLENLHMLYLWNPWGKKDINYNPLKIIDSNQDYQEGQECLPSVLCKETGTCMDCFHLKPYICYILEYLGEKDMTIIHRMSLIPIRMIREIKNVLQVFSATRQGS